MKFNCHVHHEEDVSRSDENMKEGKKATATCQSSCDHSSVPELGPEFSNPLNRSIHFPPLFPLPYKFPFFPPRLHHQSSVSKSRKSSTSSAHSHKKKKKVSFFSATTQFYRGLWLLQLCLGQLLLWCRRNPLTLQRKEPFLAH